MLAITTRAVDRIGLLPKSVLEYGRDFLHLCWGVSQNGIREAQFRDTTDQLFFFRASRLAPVRALSLYQAQAPTIAIVIQRLGMMRDSIHHLLVVLVLYCK